MTAQVEDGYADVNEVKEFAAQLRTAFLYCREMGHSWKPHTARWDDSAKCYERALRCTRCHTLRRQVLNRSGSIVSSGYDYADGYLSEHMGRIVGEGRDALRVESLNRLMEQIDSRPVAPVEPIRRRRKAG